MEFIRALIERIFGSAQQPPKGQTKANFPADAIQKITGDFGKYQLCLDTWKAAFSQSFFQIGVLLGSLIFGILSDRYGRKLPLCIASLSHSLLGIAAAYVNSFWLFTMLRVLLGACCGGMFVTSFVLLMEFVGGRYRGPMSAVYQVPHTLGHTMLPGISYFFRDYSIFQLVISVPGLICILYFIFLPDTPRWLIAKNRLKQAETVLTKCAKINNRPTENIGTLVREYHAEIEKNNQKLQKKGTLADLFRTPNMRKNMIYMSFLWFTSSYTFYGVAQYVSLITGDIFINVAVSGAVSTFGTLITIFIIMHVGRRTLCIVSNAISGIVLILVSIVPDSIASVIFSTLRIMASFITFIVVYPFCGELFPTVVRNAAIGYASMMARVGAIIAPLVTETRAFVKWVPPTLFAIFPIAAAIVSCFLPETKGQPLTSTLTEGESIGKKNPTSKSNW